MTLFQDMNAKDLFATRYIDDSQTTKWKPSPLIKSLASGKLCILDNFEQVDESVQTLLQELCQDRRISHLPDGSRFVEFSPKMDLNRFLANHPELLKAFQEANVLEIHPSFRLICIWGNDRSKKRLAPETIPSFHFIKISQLGENELCHLICEIIPQIETEDVVKLARLSSFLETAEDCRNQRCCIQF